MSDTIFPRMIISKSKYLNGLQCPKLLWHLFNAPDAVPPAGPAQEALFEQGRRVGELARRLFPGGVLLREGNMTTRDVLAATAGALARRVPLYEAAFEHRGAYFQADILVPSEGGAWDLYEVKSAASLKEAHLEDVAFQRFVLEGTGQRLNRCFLVHVDSSYVRRGALDTTRLFGAEEITRETADLVPEVPGRLGGMERVIGLPASPEVAIGPQCTNPYGCPMQPVCWAFLPDDSVTGLHRVGARAFELVSRGILDVGSVPADFRLDGKQQVQVEAARSGETQVRIGDLRRFLETLEYPLAFLDFETMGLAVPLFDESRPFQQVPFQFSLHLVEEPGGAPLHREWLASGREDPRPRLLDELRRAVPEHGSVVAYNASFEIRVLNDLARDLPASASWVASVVPRFVDLWQPFRSFAVYHPAQRGSASMKAVLPALTGRGYGELEISEGSVASTEFQRVTFDDVPDAERREVRAALLRYCALDTGGMIEILDRLRALAVG